MTLDDRSPTGAERRVVTHSLDGDDQHDAALNRLVDAIDQILPQTQCRRCGFDGCRPYAEALARGESAINRCPPGGDTGVQRLSILLNRAPLPIDPDCGPADLPRRIARIIEADCIGCTLCIQACPVDAIIGAPKRMHTVIAEHCTGCELCIPPCPVDCITLEAIAGDPSWDKVHADDARQRYQRRKARLTRREIERAQDRIAEGTVKLAELASETGTTAPTRPPTIDGSGASAFEVDLIARKRAIIEAAIQRARARVSAAATARASEPGDGRG